MLFELLTITSDALLSLLLLIENHCLLLINMFVPCPGISLAIFGSSAACVLAPHAHVVLLPVLIVPLQIYGALLSFFHSAVLLFRSVLLSVGIFCWAQIWRH